jgi:hypothetical protein
MYITAAADSRDVDTSQIRRTFRYSILNLHYETIRHSHRIPAKVKTFQRVATRCRLMIYLHSQC